MSICVCIMYIYIYIYIDIYIYRYIHHTASPREGEGALARGVVCRGVLFLKYKRDGRGPQEGRPRENMVGVNMLLA